MSFIKLPEFDSNEDLVAYFQKVEEKFRFCVRQIRLLKNRLADLQIRYDRAFKANRRSFRYTLRLQLATLEGMHNMYYAYACHRANELEALQDRLVAAGLMQDDYDDDYTDMDYDDDTDHDDVIGDNDDSDVQMDEENEA